MPDWSATLICPDEDFDGAPLLRREFELDRGHGAVRSAQSLSVPLTTVRQDKYLHGTQAAGLLLSELREDSHEHSEVLLTPELVVRAFTVGRG